MKKYSEYSYNARENIRRAIDKSKISKSAAPFYESAGSIVLPYYGDGAKSIHEHPDFAHLKFGQVQKANIAAVFVDVANSTARSYFEGLETFHEVRKAFTSTFAEVIQDTTGFVQEFPGDGVLAYFGHSNQSTCESVAYAILASSLIMKVSKEDLYDELIKQNLEPIRVKIGLEYGSVLFSRTGNEASHRVQAEGFTVNFASKLEGRAKDWNVIFGNGVLNELNINNDLFEKVDSITLSYLAHRGNTPKSFPCYKLDWEKVIEFLNLENVA